MILHEVFQLCLGWHSGKHLEGYPDPRDFLPLNDQDVTTKTVDGWKRVNTLSHYYVNDESFFQLQKNNRSEPVYQVHGMQTKFLLELIS